MMSSNASFFRVTGSLCAEFTGHRWIPLIKANDAELWTSGWSNAGDLRRNRAHYHSYAHRGLVTSFRCQHRTGLKLPSGILTGPQVMAGFLAAQSHNLDQCWLVICEVQWQSPAGNFIHYSDVIMSAMESQITSLAIVYSTAYSGADKKNHQSPASPDFVREIHRWPLN